MNPILIVDDEAAIAMLVRRILTEAGYRCQAVTDSRAAADLLEKNRYDLVLLDVMMPGKLDGLDLCRLVKSDPALGHPQVVLLSARGQSQDIEAGMNAGADAYLLKPFSPLKLIETIAQLDGAHGWL